MAVSGAGIFRSTGVIYTVTNTKNGKFYVGLTGRSAKERLAKHRWSARNCPAGTLHAAMRKHGADAFVLDIIYVAFSREALRDAEMEIIADRRPQYNGTAGGDGWRSTHTAEAKRKLSEARRGKPINHPWHGKKGIVPPHVIAAMVAAKKGKPAHNRSVPCRPDVREKIRATLKARSEQHIKSPETVAKQKASYQARKHLHKPLGWVYRQRRVMCVTDGNVFECMSAAARAYGISHPSVAEVAHGRRKQTRGLVFRFV